MLFSKQLDGTYNYVGNVATVELTNPSELTPTATLYKPDPALYLQPLHIGNLRAIVT